MASSVPRLGKAAAKQRAGHGVWQPGEAAPDKQPHSQGRGDTPRLPLQPQTGPPPLGPRASRALPPPPALPAPRAPPGVGSPGSSL